MEMQKENTTSSLLLKAFGSNPNRKFSPPNNVEPDKKFLSDNMLLALCQLFQQKLQNDQHFNVEILLPFLSQKDGTIS